MKQKANCPVCGTDIKHAAQCKVLDDYVDQVYDQFVGEGGKIHRQSLKKKRSKIKRDIEAVSAIRAHTTAVITLIYLLYSILEWFTSFFGIV